MVYNIVAVVSFFIDGFKGLFVGLCGAYVYYNLKYYLSLSVLSTTTKVIYMGMRDWIAHKRQMMQLVSRATKVLKKHARRYDFEPEDMIVYGETQLRSEVEPDKKIFHEYTVEMLIYEKTHNKADKILNMKRYALIFLEDKQLLKTFESRDMLLDMIKMLESDPDKTSLKHFYYQTGLRYVCMVLGNDATTAIKGIK